MFIGDVDKLRDSYFAQCTDRDSNFKTEWFVNNLLELHCRRCPIRVKTHSVKRYLKPWVTRNIQRMINYKHTLFKQYKEAAIPLEFHNKYKNNVNRILKTSKSNYFSNKFEYCQSNIKSTCLTINSILGHKRKKNDNITLLDNGGDEFSDSQSVADAFCDHFSTVATTLDCIPIFIYKLISHHISPIICDIFNSCITLGMFPNLLKLAKIIPLFKSKTSKLIKNYRPITLSHLLSKLK